jgi:hypothetical protein
MAPALLVSCAHELGVPALVEMPASNRLGVEVLWVRLGRDGSDDCQGSACGCPGEADAPLLSDALEVVDW